MKDDLAGVIEAKIGSAFCGGTGRAVAEEIATAVIAHIRTRLESDEAVEAGLSARFYEANNDGSSLNELFDECGYSKCDYSIGLRAAITAALNTLDPPR